MRTLLFVSILTVLSVALAFDELEDLKAALKYVQLDRSPNDVRCQRCMIRCAVSQALWPSESNCVRDCDVVCAAEQLSDVRDGNRKAFLVVLGDKDSEIVTSSPLGESPPWKKWLPFATVNGVLVEFQGGRQESIYVPNTKLSEAKIILQKHGYVEDE
jgi:hypothetical protein